MFTVLKEGSTISLGFLAIIVDVCEKEQVKVAWLFHFFRNRRPQSDRRTTAKQRASEPRHG
jgi:hypothetical protein